MRFTLGILLLMGTIGFLPGQRRGAAPSGTPAPTYGYEVVRSYPHDRNAFTQGLIFREGVFYEGTGLNGRSGIRKVKLETGEVLQSKPLGPQYFGEGITDWKGSLVQITWQSEIGFVYDMQQRSPIERAIIAFVWPHLLPSERDFVQKNEFKVAFLEMDWRLNDLTGGRVE